MTCKLREEKNIKVISEVTKINVDLFFRTFKYQNWNLNPFFAVLKKKKTLKMTPWKGKRTLFILFKESYFIIFVQV